MAPSLATDARGDDDSATQEGASSAKPAEPLERPWLGDRSLHSMGDEEIADMLGRIDELASDQFAAEVRMDRQEYAATVEWLRERFSQAMRLLGEGSVDLSLDELKSATAYAGSIDYRSEYKSRAGNLAKSLSEKLVKWQAVLKKMPQIAQVYAAARESELARDHARTEVLLANLACYGFSLFEAPGFENTGLSEDIDLGDVSQVVQQDVADRLSSLISREGKALLGGKKLPRELAKPLQDCMIKRSLADPAYEIALALNDVDALRDALRRFPDHSRGPEAEKVLAKHKQALLKTFNENIVPCAQNIKQQWANLKEIQKEHPKCQVGIGCNPQKYNRLQKERERLVERREGIREKMSEVWSSELFHNEEMDKLRAKAEEAGCGDL